MTGKIIEFKQYTVTPYGMEADYPQCSPIAIRMWSMIVDRWRSSVGKSRFFDEKSGGYYAIFTLSEFRKQIPYIKNTDTFSKYLKQLVTAGLLEKKHTMHADLLFPIVPEAYLAVEEEPNKMTKDDIDDNQNPNSGEMNLQNLGNNQRTSKHLSNTDNTDNTQKLSKLKTTNHEIIMQNLAERIISKANLPRLSVEVMVSLAVDSDRLNLYAGSIFIAKARANDEFVDAVEPTVNFEDTIVQKTFVHAVKRIIFAAERKCGKNTKYLKNYMANAFYKYFLEVHDAKTLMSSSDAAGYLFNERRRNYLMNNYVSLAV